MALVEINKDPSRKDLTVFGWLLLLFAGIVGSLLRFRWGLAFVEDAPAGIGPLGGLAALLDAAVTRGHNAVIALSCDLPYVSAELIARLATHAPDASAVAPRPDGVWQPLVARYDPRAGLEATRAALAEGDRALYRVLDRLGSGAVELPMALSDAAQLRDWDEPGDVE
jgi:molybdopterin-guanine dinucleotide biosynthesis protein A